MMEMILRMMGMERPKSLEEALDMAPRLIDMLMPGDNSAIKLAVDTFSKARFIEVCALTPRELADLWAAGEATPSDLRLVGAAICLEGLKRELASTRPEGT